MAFVTWGGNYCIAQEVTLDFTKNGWKLPTIKKPATKGEYTYNGITISIDASKNFYYNPGYLMLKSTKTAVGKLTLPTFDFAVEKIEVVGNSGASENTKENIYVGNAAVSAEKIGSNGTNEFVVDKQYQAAGNRYTLQVSAANAQITYIKIYKRAVDLTATTLTLSAVPTEPIAIGGTFLSTPTLKAGEQILSGKTITWSSDNEKVATVDENGIVTGVAAGKANITAKFAGDDVYKTSTASYEIIVKGAPSLSFPEKSYTVEMGDAFSTPKLNGLPEGVTPAYTSSKEEVATVDAATGEVKIVGVGTTTITVTSPETGIYEETTASYVLNVKAPIYKVEFDFTTNNWGLPTTDYNKGEASYTNGAGYTITFGKSNDGHKIIKDNDTDYYLIFGKEGATLSLPAFPFAVSKIKVFGRERASKYTKQNFFVGGEAVSTETIGAEKENIYEIAEAFQAAGNIYTLKVTSPNRTQITKIVVYAKDETVAGAINIATEEGYGTFYTDKNYVLPQGLTAFGYTSIDGNNTLTKSVEYVAGDIVPANTAVVVKGDKGSYNYYNTEEAATKTIERNLLKGVAAYKEIPVESGIKRYVLTKVNGVLGFYQTQSGNIKVPANRAYLELTEAQAQAVSFFQLDGETTGIENATATTKEAPKAIYTLSGVRLKATTTQGLPAGAYVVNGKVVIVK